jgi:hypothetical protein
MKEEFLEIDGIEGCNKERIHRGAGWKVGMWQGSEGVEEM